MIKRFTRKRYKPSNSTKASAIGTGLAAVIAWVLSRKGIFMPAGMEATFGGLIGAFVGYLPKSGRK